MKTSKPLSMNFAFGFAERGKLGRPLKIKGGHMIGKSYKDIYEELEKDPEYWKEGLILEFADLLWVEAFEVQKLSRKELAAKIGISTGYLTKILRGNAHFDFTLLARISLALGKEIEFKFKEHK